MTKTSERRCDGGRLLSFFAAACFFLSAAEYAVPKPLPFLRLGLSNLPLMFALEFFCAKEYFMLAALKFLLQNLISGTLLSYVALFSLCGTFSSVCAMFALHRLFFRRHLVSFFGISLGGALANSLSQVFMAGFVLFGKNARYIAPLILLNSLVTGGALGVFAEVFRARSVFLARLSRECGGVRHEG